MDPTTRACAADVARHCLASRARVLGRVLTALYQQQLAPHGLTAPQFNILTALCLVSGVPPAVLGTRLRLEKSTLSRNLRLMTEAGWVTVAGRGRGSRLSLSERGQRLYERAYPSWRRAQAQAARLLGPAGTRALGRLTAQATGS